MDERPYRLINLGSPQSYYFVDNFVKTSKYEIWNFLPKFLLEEFNPKTKLANCYFLFISGLQCITAISNTGGYPTTLFPLLIVNVVDGALQVMEDLARHKADKEANASISQRFNSDQRNFVSCLWREITVGDFVMIKSRETIAADIVILAVSEKTTTPQGLCYVETKSLDGETNLKLRSALPLTYDKVTHVTIFYVSQSLNDFTSH